MYQAVLFGADVDEQSEIGDVRDHTLNLHSNLRLVDRIDGGRRLGHLELAAPIADARLELADDRLQRALGMLLVGELGEVDAGQSSGIVQRLLGLDPGGLEDLRELPVVARMDAGSVQRILSTVDPQEAGSLLVDASIEPGHLAERRPAAERAVLAAVLDDTAGNALGHSRYERQQIGRGRVDVNAHILDGRFLRLTQGGAQILLVDFVVALANAKHTRVEPDQLAHGILHAAGRDRRRSARPAHPPETPSGRPWRLRRSSYPLRSSRARRTPGPIS